MSLLVADRVTVRRGGRAILEDASASFEGGAFVAMIGANGAGKSTLLSVLAGLLKPDQGEARLDGRPMAGLDRKTLARRRAYLPQNPRCEWPIPVERLVGLGLTPSLPAFGDFSPDMRERIGRAIHDCDLDSHRLQPATTLSGGELARAMLARALVGDPEVLIADEPMAGLDPRHALDTMRRLEALARGGTLVIAAVHDLTLAARYCDRLVALDGGRVAAMGSPAQVLSPQGLKTVFGLDGALIDTAHGAAAVADRSPQ
jgi:iron complex transport system ATP-binding protein